ncbi:DNA polymerase III subunit psi [Serratia microhaemolytica]|uniref:DNA polymerase III subunit psi n=1 Tax=Serratia microhaemolytica TaxID=2675110 RepID=UPI000FDE9D1A|nr:DNA polymerase III subunit psi [Serratia microhaemolytica]
MTSRRDWLLQQMGVDQWELRNPAALRGEIAIQLPAAVRLLVVAEPLPALDDPLFADVLRTLGLSEGEIYRLTPQQAVMLPPQTACHCWRLGIETQLPLAGVQLFSPALAELSHSVEAKRSLWQQICHYESDFYPYSRRSASGAEY